ncbi:MAG: dicarboxylate/amino acid:cation symporter [bacterium]|nr:dicarboxylate/amino acid:cation symporter [bacterium]
MRKLPLWGRISIALFAGLLVGVTADSLGAGELVSAILPLGTLFIKLLSMLIVPLIFSTLLIGTAGVGNLQKLGRIGRKTVGLYALTTIVAVAIGLSFGILFQPGAGVELEQDVAREIHEFPGLLATLVNSIPANPVKALADGNIIQLIIFAIFSGVCVSLAGHRAKVVLDFFEGMAEVMFKMTQVVIEYAPYGVFALIAVVAGEHGVDILRPLGKLIVLVYVGSFLHVALVYGTLVKLLGKMSPLFFFKRLSNAMLLAFTTSSSTATLPVTMQCAQEHLGVSKDVASFVLPVGSTINMDGTALYLGIATVFIAQFYGIPLSAGDYLTIGVTAIIVSIGAAGVPGAAAIMIVLVLQHIRLPAEGVALIVGIDRILDMARSCLNVTGDACVSVVVAESEGELHPYIEKGSAVRR